MAAKRNSQAINQPLGNRDLAGDRMGFDTSNSHSAGRVEPRLSLADIELPGMAPSAPRQDRQLAGLAEKMREVPASQRSADDARLTAMQHELADMRSLLEQHMQRMAEPNTQSTAPAKPAIPKPAVNHSALQQHLGRLGLPVDITETLSQQFGSEPRLNMAWRDALNDLASQIPVNGSDCIDQGGIFAFVGPTGVGKTTTIAKLAARYVLTHGQGKVALVTTDTYRVGAQDQLRALGRILNVPVKVIDQERSLPAVLASLKAFPLVLIDTAGFRQGDPLLKEQEAMLASCANVQRILVMAGNSQLQTLKASAHAYKSRRLTGCILTKIDETLSLGEAISVVIQQAIPLLYTTDGQEIPRDIAVASAHQMVAKAVSLTKAQDRADAGEKEMRDASHR